METQICVIDAKTLVDHIQDIKIWIYSRQLRLVVPSCTIEQVEQLCQRSSEPKTTTQEAPRSRSSGKPPKKEYPAFDINPRVAREYLGRLKTRKEQDADSELRLFFHEKENHEAVRFQQPNEQYTPWKDLDVEEEKPEAIEGPPTSWAEALRRKQNLANGISEKSSKAPTKPKLVARAAGSETSPWKVRKDAPKISAKDVPGALRPLMSCALWHLHESIERNDPNQLFLLSDQPEIVSVAQALNIAVQSCKEVGATIASKANKTDLDTFGDLERNFGAQQRIAVVPTQDAEQGNGEDDVPENAIGHLKEEDVMNNSVSSERTANTEGSSIVHVQELLKQNSEGEEDKFLVKDDRCEDEVKEQDVMAETATPLTKEHVSKKPAKSVESIKGLVDSIIQQDFQKQLSGTVNGLKINAVKSENNLGNESASEYSEMRSHPNTPLAQPQILERVQLVQDDQTINESSPSQNTSTPSTTKEEAPQESEDSDEEVVVFVPQPKRLSAQQRPPQQSSRPSTPKEQSQQKPTGQSPQNSLVKPPPKGRASRHSPNPSLVAPAHPQSINAPTIIDPDAFGRDFRVNLNTSPRLPHHPNGHSNHRIRGNMHNAQAGPSRQPRNSPRQLARTSPPRNALQEDLRHPGPAPKDAPNHRRQASRTSPRRAPAPKAEEVMPADVDFRANTVAVPSKSLFPESQMVDSSEFMPQTSFSVWNPPGPSEIHEPTDFVPGSALPNADLKPNGSQPKIYEANEFVPRPPRPVREFKPRAPRPKVFEAAEFVPRDFVPRTAMPRAQPKQYPPEPEFIEPRPSINDVDYVLKSGSTRASARGRGRLWTPS